MPRYKVTYVRSVREYDEYSAEMQATNEVEARENAEAACEEFDRDCPDVDRTYGAECESWTVESITPLEPAQEPATAPTLSPVRAALILALEEIHHPGSARNAGRDITEVLEAAIAHCEPPTQPGATPA